jgi:hypothetical protein
VSVVAVVVSDLHLGDERSALCPAAAAAAGKTYTDYLDDCFFGPLRDALPGGHAKFLVLNGDTIDFSLQSFGDAIAKASVFMRALAAAKLFDELVFIPGNHDHNVWQLVQQEVMFTRRVAAGLEPKPFPYLQAGLLNLSSQSLTLPKVGGPYGDVFLKGLFQLGADSSPAPDLPIAVVYPNLFVFPEAEKRRPIIVTHGHFFCLPWIILTEVFPRSLGIDRGLSLMELEQINSPLTELGWTSLGQAGRLTSVVRRLYDECSDGDTRALSGVIDELARFFDEKIFPYARYDPREWASDVAIKAAKALLHGAVTNALDGASSHRGSKLFLDKPENVALVDKYLGLTRSQYSDVVGGQNAGVPGALIFGHTHVPIRPDHGGSVTIQRFGTSYSIRAYNSGGWILDGRNAGAIALTIDDRGDIGSIELGASAAP